MQVTPLDAFSDLLSPRLRARLAAAGVNGLFPVQAATVRAVCAGSDVVVRSRTGSGKTLGFVVPVAELLERHSKSAAPGSLRDPRCIVLAPTRELANQIEKEFLRVGGMRVMSAYGGTALGPQLGALRAGVDVVVGTPGRVADLARQGALRLGSIRVTVLDEADEMLRMGFKEEVEGILAGTPSAKQSMLWSATVPQWVRELARTELKNPTFVDLVGDEAAKLPSTMRAIAHIVPEDDQGSIAAARTARDDALTAVLVALVGPAARESASGGAVRVLVFTETKIEASRLATLPLLTAGIRAAALTGDMSQAAREAALAAYRSGRLDVLFATDVAARGLDIEDVGAVVQYRLPRSSEAFVHRTGRTGRAGKAGLVTVLASPQEMGLLRRLERELGFIFGINALPEVLPQGVIPAGVDGAPPRLSLPAMKRIDGAIVGAAGSIAAAAAASELTARLVERFGSADAALSAALGVIVNGGSALLDASTAAGSATKRSLITGAPGVVTAVLDTTAAAWPTVTGTPNPKPLASPDAMTSSFLAGAFDRAAAFGLTKVLAAAGVDAKVRDAGRGFPALGGAWVFDVPFRTFEKAASVGEGTLVRAADTLPVEVRAILARAPGQLNSFDRLPPGRSSRSSFSRGGRSGGGGGGGPRSSFRGGRF